MSEALDSAIKRHQTGDIDGARQRAFAALERAPGDSALLHFLAMVEGRAGNLLLARSLFERAVLADQADALFADAPMLFMLRHPCDVVLSCFITRFQLNWGVASFLGLDDTVAAYDRVMRIWLKARERCRLNVHEIRYEELIRCPEGVLREVARFAAVEFDPAMLQHAATARARGHIATPSHAQVAQPIYHDSAGRWRRYRTQLAPYLPLLKPWCERFGYTTDD